MKYHILNIPLKSVLETLTMTEGFTEIRIYVFISLLRYCAKKVVYIVQ